jgi:hypothetical protein
LFWSESEECLGHQECSLFDQFVPRSRRNCTSISHISWKHDLNEDKITEEERKREERRFLYYGAESRSWNSFDRWNVFWIASSFQRVLISWANWGVKSKG